MAATRADLAVRARKRAFPAVQGPVALNGVVIRSHGLYHDVRTDAGVLRTTARGRLKRERRETGGIAVGDRVVVEQTAEAEGVIVEVTPRDRVLVRRGILRGQPDQIILANASRLLAVFAVAQPEPHLRMLDRFLVLASAHELEAIVCANKVDLDETGELREPFRLYERIGYRVLYTSSRTDAGVNELASVLAGQITVLAGPSGVGKTSLINRIAGSELRTGDISGATGKGRHTTRGAVLVPVGDGYLADTAGIRALALAGVNRDELDLHFPEMEPYLGRCRFPNCNHEGEPGCAVEGGAGVDRRRLESYRRLRSSFFDD